MKDVFFPRAAWLVRRSDPSRTERGPDRGDHKTCFFFAEAISCRVFPSPQRSLATFCLRRSDLSICIYVRRCDVSHRVGAVLQLPHVEVVGRQGEALPEQLVIGLVRYNKLLLI